MNTYEIAGIAGDWKAQDGSVVYVSQLGAVEKNYNPFPVGIGLDANGQFLFNGFVGELVSPDVILWRSETSDAFTLWTRQNKSGESSCAFNSNPNFYEQECPTEAPILEHSVYRRAPHRHRTFAFVPMWLPKVLVTVLGGVFQNIRLYKLGYVKLEYKDPLNRETIHAVQASVDFFNVSKTEFIVNIVFPYIRITSIFPFRRISVLVSISDGKILVRQVSGLKHPRVLRSYRFNVPLEIANSIFMRELNLQDVDTLSFAVRSSHHLDRYLSNFVKETGSSVARCQWALEAWQRGSRLGQSVHLGLFDERSLLGVVHVDKKLVGSIKLGVTEYWLASQATGKGLAPFFTVSALHWAKEALGIEEAHFDVHPDNEPSVKVLRKLGAVIQKQKKKKCKDDKIFDAYRLNLDAEWQVLKSAQRPWITQKSKSLQTEFRVINDTETDDIAVEPDRINSRHTQRRHSITHSTYFSREVAPIETPGALAHRMRIPVTGPGIALRQVIGGSNGKGEGSWFIIFVKEFDWNSSSRDLILALQRFWNADDCYFGQEHVVSLVDLNQCDSSDQRDSLIARFKLSVADLPQARLLFSGRVTPYEGSLSDKNAISSFLNNKTRATTRPDH